MTEGTQNTIPVPAWLNIDAVCPAEMRAEMAEITGLAEKLAEELDSLAHRSFLALRAADDAMPLTPDLPVRAELPIDLFTILTGSDRLRSAFYNISAIAAAGGDDPLGRGDCPDWHTDSQGRSTVKMAELRRKAGGSLLGVEIDEDDEGNLSIAS